MERKLNISIAIGASVVCVAALYGAIFGGAPHQLNIALITAAVAWIMFDEVKKTKNE